MKVCADCPTPGKCRAAGKCLNKKKSSKKMGKPKAGDVNESKTRSPYKVKDGYMVRD